ncbi:monocarboxylate transporter 14-like isoform X2 [Battus philenor]
MGSTSITFLNGINALCVSISGFIGGFLLKFITIRQLGLIAAIFLNLGSFAVIFVNSKLVLFICHGFLFSIGHGLLTIISYTIITAYFLKRRLLSFSLCQSVSAVAALFSPQLVQFALNFYGFRGTLMLLSAINLHTFVAVCLMQPVAWHLKKSEIRNDTEMKLLLHNNTKNEITVNVIEEDVEKKNFDTAIKDKVDSDLNSAKNRLNTFRKEVVKAIDLRLLRSFLWSNAALGLAICGSSDLIFGFILPQVLYSMNLTANQVTLGVSMLSLGELITKIMFILFNNMLVKFKSVQILSIGIFIAVVTRIGMVMSKNVAAILAFLAIMGASRSTIFVLIPLVIGDAVKPEQFTSATGIFMLAFGFTNLIIAPTIGAVRDLTDSYPAAIYILTTCFGIMFISYVVEMYTKRNRKK